ncbi:helix-turn-helix domain-containing protein [Floccifex sp.]|uniref:helix-turn-helix domain-containing protein n=1 Tax=Floccifex sp. TaxID=2815810 RepID=UPI002A762D42|nr:AraC family transcriptional regulator [Floccifex sp.]MDD7282147.1 AraC family transcriptional regulator [Erysipelotrichaceae bacterium]MDY2959040.1 AraC family transcriptional regulator [Floccifex sp.]
MFNKTSSVEFLKYGDVYGDSSDQSYDENHILTIQNDSFTYMFVADDDVYVKTCEGICMLVVSNVLDPDQFEEFVIHRTIKINKGTFFNFIPLGNQAKIEMAFSQSTSIINKFFKNIYCHKKIKPTLRINELVAYYYNIRSSNYTFIGEKDQHWEITYVDSGTLYTNIEGNDFEVHSNELIVYAPEQFHTQSTKEGVCSYLTFIVSMDISEDDKAKITERVFKISREARSALEKFVQADDSKSPYDENDMIFSLEKVINSILISATQKENKVASTPMQQRFENELMNEILLHINQNIYTSLNVEEICDYFALSRSTLQTLFRNNLNVAPKEYISNLKLEKSKLLIKESKYTISEIASILGFSSIHYFSRRFKQKFGINPSEYANKIL